MIAAYSLCEVQYASMHRPRCMQLLYLQGGKHLSLARCESTEHETAAMVHSRYTFVTIAKLTQTDKRNCVILRLSIIKAQALVGLSDGAVITERHAGDGHQQKY